MSDEPGAGRERARVRLIYAFGVVLIVMALVSLTDAFGKPVDLGIFGTLAGVEVALIGAGSVIRLVGLK